MARRDGGGVLALALVLDGVEVQGREAEMLGAGFRGRVDLRREEPLVRPGEDGGVGRRGLEAVVLAGDVEREVEEGLGPGLDERREAIKNPSGLVFLFCFRVLRSWYIRRVVRPMQPLQVRVQVPCPVGVLPQVVRDIPKSAHPGGPVLQRR